MASLLYHSANFYYKDFQILGSCTMPLNHCTHAHVLSSTPCHITTPTKHDYIHAMPLISLLLIVGRRGLLPQCYVAEYFNLALSLSLKFLADQVVSVVRCP